MNSIVKSIISTLVIISFIIMAMASYSGYSDTKGRKFGDELCRTLDEAVTYEADIYVSVINKETLEPVPGVEIIIKAYHYEAVTKRVGENLECSKKLILTKELKENTNEYGVVTFRPGTYIFVHPLDLVQVIVDANLKEGGYYQEVFTRHHQDISNIDVTYEVLNKESL